PLAPAARTSSLGFSMESRRRGKTVSRPSECSLRLGQVVVHVVVQLLQLLAGLDQPFQFGAVVLAVHLAHHLDALADLRRVDDVYPQQLLRVERVADLAARLEGLARLR